MIRQTLRYLTLLVMDRVAGVLLMIGAFFIVIARGLEQEVSHEQVRLWLN